MVRAFVVVVVVEGSVQFVPWVVVVSRLSEEWLEGGQSTLGMYIPIVNVKLQGCKVTTIQPPKAERFSAGRYLPNGWSPSYYVRTSIPCFI